MSDTKKIGKSVFDTLNAINVNGKTEKKNGLTYLSWAFAWGEIKKTYPDATYTIYKDEKQRPYIEDEDLGLMCYTTVTINGQTHEMWLPVLDGANKSMKRKPYNYNVWDYKEKQWKEKTVAAATMFDVNKTIMRCLTKNLAMFGLGLYIYAGEDLPENEQPTSANDNNIQSSTAAPPQQPVQQQPVTIDTIKGWIASAKTESNLMSVYKATPKELLEQVKPILSARKQELQSQKQ